MSDSSMRYFCTCFDQFFLPRGLALYASLQKYCNSFTLYVFCHDNETLDYFTAHPHDGVVPISISEVESFEPGLKEARANRSRIEFYFTCTPALPLYILANYPHVNLISYIDADFFFYSSPEPLYREFSNGSIGIIEHRYAFGARRFGKYGVYNVGWLIFRRDEQGFSCLRWWLDRCIEWCYDRYEDGKFADQKYLDGWPDRFNNVVVLENKGVNVAGWNIRNNRISVQDGMVYIDDSPLICFHFAGFKEVRPQIFKAGFAGYFLWPSRIVRRKIFEPYIQTLSTFDGESVGKRIRITDTHITSFIKNYRNITRVLRSIIFCDYLLYFRGKIW
ncbi:MAG: hypothetical protein JZU65_20825 [Chlorobium sp.]|nr:hypothetical protein [Chlorobium sp.]